MIIKSSRLPRDEFRSRAYRTAATPFFLIKTKENGTKKARIGIVVGKTVHKTAAKRNFWKRQAKAGIAPVIREGLDTLVILLPGVTRLTKKQFQDAMKRAVTKIPSGIKK